MCEALASENHCHSLMYGGYTRAGVSRSEMEETFQRDRG